MVTERFQECIEACQECVVACEHCAASCLREDDVKMMARCIALGLSCANACELAVREMSRDSELADRVCGFCAELCDACAEECARHDRDHCQYCAEVCRDCAESCREIVHTQAA